MANKRLQKELRIFQQSVKLLSISKLIYL